MLDGAWWVDAWKPLPPDLHAGMAQTATVDVATEPVVLQQMDGGRIDLAIDQGLGVLVWSPIAGGLLSGKYRRGQDAPEGTRRFEGWTEPPVHDEDRLYATIDELVAIGEGQRGHAVLGRTLGEHARSGCAVSQRVARRDMEVDEGIRHVRTLSSR